MFNIYHFGDRIMNWLSRNDKLAAAFYEGRKQHLAASMLLSKHSSAELNILQIKKGVFRGLSYDLTEELWFDSQESLIQKCFGTYEQEVLNFLSSNKWNIFIDIGAGTGYYSFGMLKNNLCDFAIMYEANANYLNLTLENAKLNGIENSKFLTRGPANAEDIISQFDSTQRNYDVSSLLLCDIEGYENKLFDSKFLKELADREIILCIEVHKAQFFKYGNNENFMTNLLNFFDVTELSTMCRDLTSTFSAAPLVTDRWLLASENRSEGCQLVCLPKYL